MSKYRTSFVTNSSSSSFVCEVCGASEEGYDVSLSDLGFVQCANGHEFCEHHALPLENPKEVLKVELKDFISRKNPKYWAEEISEAKLLLARVDDMAPEDAEEKFNEYTDNELPAACCPICTLDTVRDADILMYIAKKTGVKTSEVTHEIRQQFGTLDELKKYLKED